MRLEVSASIILWNISQNIIRSGKTAVNYMQSIKPIKTGVEAFLCFKLTNGHWAVKKIVVLF